MTKKASPGKVVVFRLWPPYSVLLEEKARAAKMKVNDFARVATMSATDAGLLDLHERLKKFETEIVRQLVRLGKVVEEQSDDGGSC